MRADCAKMTCTPDKERTRKQILILQEEPPRSLLVMPVSLAAVGLVVVATLSQDSIPAGAAITLIIVSLACIGLYLSHRVTLEIDPACGSMTKRWRIVFWSVKKTYQLRDYLSVQIREKETPFEGYSLSRYVLYLTDNLRSLKLFETCDQAEAEKIRENIAALMIR